MVCLVVLIGAGARFGSREFLISARRSDIQLAAAAACLLRSACSSLRVIVRSAHFPAVSSQRSFLWSECFSRSASGSVNRTSRSSASPMLMVLLGPVLLVVFLLCVSSLWYSDFMASLAFAVSMRCFSSLTALCSVAVPSHVLRYAACTAFQPSWFFIWSPAIIATWNRA